MPYEQRKPRYNPVGDSVELIFKSHQIASSHRDAAHTPPLPIDCAYNMAVSASRRSSGDALNV
jgi:hypothetical protein